MIGWVSRWTALVMLLVWAAAPTSVEGVDDLTLVSMDWTYDDETGTTFLTVCTDKNLLDGNITLTLNNSMLDVLDGTVIGGLVDDNDTCAQFDISGNQPFPAEMTTYTLSTENFLRQQSGSVTFSLEGATITCGTVPFLRFSNGAETVDGDICTSLDSVCYVADKDVESDPICFTGLDVDNLDFQVCTQKEAFSALDPYGGSLTADVLNYNAMSFTFAFDDGDLSLAELLILLDESSWTAVSCDDKTCVDDTFKSSIAYYNLCGVFVDEDGTAVSSGEANFQDLDLKVDTVEPTVDFHFIKVTDNDLYLVSGMDVTYGAVDEISDFTLDCSHITQGTICNGFFPANDALKNIAVSYADKTNTIIAPVPAS